MFSKLIIMELQKIKHNTIEEASVPEDVCTGIEDIILSQRMKLIFNYTMSCIYMNKVYQNPKRKALIKKIRNMQMKLS